MKVYVITSDSKINETIEMHEYIFQKYWPVADITVLGYTEPDYKSDFIKFESLGEDLGADVLNKQLYDYFLKLDESQFIFCVDDMPILKSVDIELINYTEELLKDNKTVGRVGLTADNAGRDHEIITNISDDIKLLQNLNTEVDCTYKLSATWSAWNRDYFLLYLNDYDNLWQWETAGSTKSNRDEFKILGYIPSPIIHSHMIKQGNIKWDWYKGCIDSKLLNAFGGEIDMIHEDQEKLKGIYNL